MGALATVAMVKRAVIYARFSSDRQNERSIDDQISFCRTIAERAGYRVVATYSDRAISGASTLNRPGFTKLLTDASGRAFDVVVVEDIDRAFRDEADYHLARKRLTFNEIEMHAAGGLVGRVEGSVRALLSALALETLALHVRRGLSGVIQSGRSAGGRSYGYELVEGKKGQLRIVKREALIVRRIFAEYAKGKSPRAIAAALNRDGVLGPRGGAWNASTIAGSRKRQNGVLQNALYDGKLIWNRQRFIKNPDTARRISRPNPKTEWRVIDVPHLRIVDRELFAKAQARKAERGGAIRYHRTRPRHLFSGLLKCGCCGSGYVVTSKDKRGLVLGCSRAKETGLCDNRRTIGLNAVERLVLKGIEQHLGDPEYIKTYVREYCRAWELLSASAGKRQRQLDQRLDRVKRDAKRIAELLIRGTAAVTLTERLAELESERARLEAERLETPPPPLPAPPHVAEAYRLKIADLKATLSAGGDELCAEVSSAIRDLIEKIVLRPTGRYAPVDIEVHGHLGAADPQSGGVVVAGDRNQLNLLLCAAA